MHEPYGSPAHEPGAGDRAYPAGQHETRAFDAHPYGARPDDAAETQAFEPSPYPRPRPGPAYEPFAHEGGLPYGAPPAPAYGPPPQQYIPQHLAMPPQFAPNPYGPPQYAQPYMYPPQQTVFVNNNGGRRVSHGLHLVLTLLTAGLWLPVWIILAIANS